MIVLGSEMMEPISQRTLDDCSICVTAMVMGPPYNYERVLEDSKKYPKSDGKGRAIAWWKDYLNDEGYKVEHKPLSDPSSFSDFFSIPDDSRAMLVFRVPHLRIGHIVAVDRSGVIDPQEQPAHYRTIDDFSGIFRIEGWRLYSPHFWLIRERART
jgi:hypothetical protein